MPGQAVRSLLMSLLVVALFGACSSDPAEPPSDDAVAALLFDGSNDYVQVADAQALDLTDQVTLSAWVYFPGGVAGEAGIIQKDGPGSFGRYGLWVLDDRLDFCVYIDGGSQSCLYSGKKLTLNAWSHIAGVYDGADLRLYVNGTLDASQALTGGISTSDAPLYIGGDPTETAFLVGAIHEVQVWNTARTPAQIASGMHARPTGSEAGLVGYWPLDEGSGQVVNAATPGNLNGTLGSGATADAADPAWTTAPWPHQQ